MKHIFMHFLKFQPFLLYNSISNTCFIFDFYKLSTWNKFDLNFLNKERKTVQPHILPRVERRGLETRRGIHNWYTIKRSAKSLL